MKKMAIVALMFAFITTPALAADNTGNVYIGGDFGLVTLSDTNPGGTDLPNPKSIRFSGGYHIGPILAVELGYVIIGDSTLALGADSVTEKNSAVQVAAVGTFQVNSSFDIIGKFGLSLNSNKTSGTGTLAGLNTSNSKTAFMYGIGAQYNVNQQVSLRAQYEDFGTTTISSNLSGMSWDGGIKQFSFGVVFNL